MRRWTKIGSGIAVGVTTIIALFVLLSTNFGFIITDLTGNFSCEGSYNNPCISEFNVQNPTPYNVDIYSKDQVKLDFSPDIYDYGLFVPDGRCSATGGCACVLSDGRKFGFDGWRCVDFTNKTKPLKDKVYNFRFPSYSTIKFRLAGLKNDVYDEVKWGFETNNKTLDPTWLPKANILNNLTDHTIYNKSLNKCVADNLGMSLEISPCNSHDVDGLGIEQNVKFKWNGLSSQNVGWVFVYEGNLTGAKLYVWGNRTENFTYSGYENNWVDDYLIPSVLEYNNLGTPDERCDIGNQNNTKMYSVKTNSTTTINFCFTSQTQVNTTSFRISGNYDKFINFIEEKQVSDWIDRSNVVESLGDVLSNGMSFYKIQNYEFEPGEIVSTKWIFDSPTGKKGKWHILGYNSDKNLFQAITDDEYIYMDPWYSSDWAHKQNISGLTGNIISIRVNKTSTMKSDYSDIRFTDASETYEIPHLLVTGNSTQAQFKVQVNGSSSIYMYYNNTGASSTSDARRVYHPNLQGLWLFEDSNYGNFINTSNNGTNVNGYIYSYVNMSWNAYASNNTGYVKNLTYPTPSEFSFVGFVKFMSTEGAVMGFSDVSFSSKVLEYRATGTLIQFVVGTGASNVITSTKVATDQNWHYYVATAKASDEIRLYYDSGSNSTASAITTIGNSNPELCLGCFNSAAGTYVREIDGSLDDLMYITEKLNSSQVDYFKQQTTPNAVFGPDETETAVGGNEVPLFYNITLTPTNGTQIDSGHVNISININNTNGTAGVDFGNVNYTLTNATYTGSLFNTTNSSLGKGTYPYYFWAFGNVTGNYSSSSTYYYTINTSIEYPQFSNLQDNNDTFVDSGTVTINSTITHNNNTVYLTFNGDIHLMTNDSYTGEVFNVTFDFAQTGDFIYNITAYGNDTDNTLNNTINYYYHINASASLTNPKIIGTFINTTSMDGIRGLAFNGDRLLFGASAPANAMTILNITSNGVVEQISSYVNSTSIGGAFGIVEKDNLVYVSNGADSGDDGFTIINVTDAHNPVQISYFSNATSMAWSRSLAIEGNYLSIVSYSTGRLSIVNVTDPYNPVQISSINNSRLNPVTPPVYMQVYNDIAYIVTNDKTLEIINITDKLNPVELGYYYNTSMELVRTVEVIYPLAYIGGFDDDFRIINITDPTNPIDIGNYVNSTAIDTTHDIMVNGNYAFVLGANSNSLSVMNITDKTNPTQIGYLQDAVNLDNPFMGHYRNNYIYVSILEGDGISIIEVGGTEADNCTYTSGNWMVGCSDECVVTSNINLTGYNLTLGGEGHFYIKANITNVGILDFGGGVDVCEAVFDDGTYIITA